MLLFDVLTPVQKRKAFEFGSLSCYCSRSLIIRQGSVANGIYIICNGVVESVFYTESDRELQLAAWGKNDFFGAPHIFGEEKQQWSARALTDVELLHLNQNQLRDIIHYSPAISISLIQALGYKGERYSELAQRLAFHTVQERLALELLDTWHHAAQYGNEYHSVPIPSVLELSRSIGATRQAVGLAMKSLLDRGLVSLNKGRFSLPSVPALEKLAGVESADSSVHNYAAHS